MHIFSYLLKQYGVYVQIICGPFTIRVTRLKSVYICPFVHMCYAPKPLNRIQSNFMCNQLPVMCTAHGQVPDGKCGTQIGRANGLTQWL